MTTRPESTALLVPPKRLGELLTSRRDQMGRTVAELERESLGQISAHDLSLYEGGEASPTDDQLRVLANIYGVEMAAITPQRAVLELDLAEGILSVNGEEERFAPDQDDREILLRYLAIVYRMRAINPGVVVPARNDDLATLALVFSTTPSEIRVMLESLMLGERTELRKRHADLKRRVIIPGLGVLVALTTVGGLLLVRQTHASSTSPVGTTPTTTTISKAVEIGTGLVVHRSAPAAVGVDIGSALVIERADPGPKPGGVDIGSALVIERADPGPKPGGVDIGSALVIER